MRKKLILLAVVAMLAICLGIAGCGGGEGKSIKVTFHGVEDKVIQAEAGKEIELPSAPVKEGYTFVGWFIDEQLTEPFDAKKGSDKDIEVWAKFTANTNTPYAVVHMQQDVTGDGFTEKERETKTGTTDTQTAAAAKDYTGFTAQTVTQATIAGNGSTVVEIRYLRDTYTITLDNANGTENKVFSDIRYGTGAAVLYEEANKPIKLGYNFEGWYVDAERLDEEDVLVANATYTAKYVPATDTPYTIEYYLEGADGTFAKDAEKTDAKTGTTDAEVTAEPKQIEHYNFDEDNAGNIKQGTVAANGSLVLRLYYTRKSYNITFKNGDTVLGEVLSVKYGEMPVYSGETPTKETTASTFYLFRDFGNIVPAEKDTEYTAVYYELKNYSGYRFLETFALPDVTAQFDGAEIKQYLDESEITGTEQTAQIGVHTWKIAVMDGADILSEASMQIEVVEEEKYYAEYGLGDNDQFVDRFSVDVASGLTFGYEALDEEVYGVSGAYHYNAPDPNITPDHKWIVFTSTNRGDVKAGEYTALEFDIWLLGGNPSFSFVVFGEGPVNAANGTFYQTSWQILEKSTGTVVSREQVEAGKWYNVRVEVPVNMDDTEPVHIVFANDNESAELYLRNVHFTKLEGANDYFIHMRNISKATISYDANDVGGRTGTYKYVSTDGAWNARVQFSENALSAWNEEMAKGGSKFVFDVYFAEGTDALYFRPIGENLPREFYLTSSQYVTVKNAEGEQVSEFVAGEWYTVQIQIDNLGLMEHSGEDVGLQIAAFVNGGGAGGQFWFDNCHFEEGEIQLNVPTDYFSVIGTGECDACVRRK